MQHEFQDPRSQPTVAANLAPDGETRREWESVSRSGANWFYWIAALSLLNSIIFFSGVQRSFIIGLAVTQVLDGLFQSAAVEAGVALSVIGLLISGLIAAGVAFFGIFANRRKSWAFALGIAFYALDGSVFLLIEDWGALAFHVFVLYRLASGWSAAVKCNRAPSAMVGGYVAPVS